MKTAEEILHEHVDKKQLDELLENVWPDIIHAMNELMAQKKDAKFEYYFVIGEKPDYVKIKYTEVNDGLNSTVRFPHVGDLVLIKGVWYLCEAVSHNYDEGAIGFHLLKTDLK